MPRPVGDIFPSITSFHPYDPISQIGKTKVQRFYGTGQENIHIIPYL